MSMLVLLGPQRVHPSLADAVSRVGVEGPMAAVTAGWEEREDEIDELSEHLGRAVLNLRLYRRAEHIFRRDPEFLEGYLEKRSRLRELRDLYRLRLANLMDTVRELEHRAGRRDVVRAERDDALEAVRALDERQLEQRAAVLREFEERWKPRERQGVALHRRRVEELMSECGAIAFAGGHVRTLLNRLRLFGIADLIGDRPVFAWSAGAMAVCERVVLYHDHPPQGSGDAQVLDHGLGLCPGVIALPHASRRLSLDDPDRVALFARRFAPYRPVALDDASGLMWDGANWEFLGKGARRLTTDGQVVALRGSDA